MFLDAVDADREAAQPVTCRIDEIGQAHIGALARFLHLLAQEGQHGMRFAFGIVEDHVVAMACTGPQAGDAARGEPFFRDDPIEHGVGIGLQAARAFAHDLVVEDLGIGAMQFPGAEERGPVEILAQFGEIPVVEHMDPRL